MTSPPLTREERERLKRAIDRAARERIGVDSRGRMLGKSTQAGALARARNFLLGALEDGPRPRAELVEAAAALGISEWALMKAKQSVGVESRSDGPSRSWRLHAHREGGE